MGGWTLDDLIGDQIGLETIARNTGDGTQHSEHLEEEKEENPLGPSTSSAPKMGISESVDRTVAAYLQTQAQRKIRQTQGIPESASQEKKQAKKMQVEERKRRVEAKFAKRKSEMQGR